MLNKETMIQLINVPAELYFLPLYFSNVNWLGQEASIASRFPELVQPPFFLLNFYFTTKRSASFRRLFSLIIFEKFWNFIQVTNLFLLNLVRVAVFRHEHLISTAMCAIIRVPYFYLVYFTLCRALIFDFRRGLVLESDCAILNHHELLLSKPPNTVILVFVHGGVIRATVDL